MAPFVDRFTCADSLNNVDGLIWMYGLAELLENKELKEKLPKYILEQLKNSIEVGFERFEN